MTKKRFYYGYKKGQYADLYRNDSCAKLPVVILLHGGSWKGNHDLNSYATRELIQPLLHMRMAVWNLEYRRMQSRGENKEAPWPAVLSDVADGIDFLRSIADEENLDLERILLIGHSAGGHLATWATSRKNLPQYSELYCKTPLLPQRMISIAGVLDFSKISCLSEAKQVERLLGGTAKQVPQRYIESDPMKLTRGLRIPQLIIQGGSDVDVPPIQGRSYRDNSDNPNLTYIEWPEADHFSMLLEPGHKQWPLLCGLIENEVRALTQCMASY